MIDSLPDRISDMIDSADLDIEPEDNFSDASSMISALETMFIHSSETQERVSDVVQCLKDAISDVSSKVQGRYVEWGSDDVSPSKISSPIGGRSLFSDVEA